MPLRFSGAHQLFTRAPTVSLHELGRLRSPFVNGAKIWIDYLDGRGGAPLASQKNEMLELTSVFEVPASLCARVN